MYTAKEAGVVVYNLQRPEVQPRDSASQAQLVSDIKPGVHRSVAADDCVYAALAETGQGPFDPPYPGGSDAVTRCIP
jgi:hypothetical protein